jgi:hypothetical protein
MMVTLIRKLEEKMNKKDPNRKITVVEGKVLDMQDRDVTFSPFTSYAKKQKFNGTQFKVDSKEGVKEIEFPRAFSLTDRKNIRGELVKIVKNELFVSESCDNYQITKYELNILSGSLKGESIKTKEIYA